MESFLHHMLVSACDDSQNDSQWRSWEKSFSVFPSGMWSPVTAGLCSPCHSGILPFLGATLIFAALSTGVQTTLCLWEEEDEKGGRPGWEKTAAIFTAGPDYHTAEVLCLGSDTRFQPFTFPGLLKSGDEKASEGAEVLWRDFCPHRKCCVSGDTVCSISQSQSVSIRATSQLPATNTSHWAPLTSTETFLFRDTTAASGLETPTDTKNAVFKQHERHLKAWRINLWSLLTTLLVSHVKNNEMFVFVMLSFILSHKLYVLSKITVRAWNTERIITFG